MSTRLLHSLGAEGYADALAEHRRVIRDACEGGVEVDTQGDAFFFAFPTAPGALAAASALHANDRGSWQLSQWLQWLHSAFARVRWGFLARAEAAANRPFERTGANRRERSPALAMQKVVGSSPIIRSRKSPAQAGFFIGGLVASRLAQGA